ncbi:hypothetical protein ACOKM3_04625 [Streptomyces sp. BH106]|uniref:hypothetical protein n=1 Tax=Streptomyces sp. BH106 TaxID=3410409 RepID=UPI003CEDB575
MEDGQEARIGFDPRVKESTFDVTRSAEGGATTASATIKGLRSKQVSTFAVTGSRPTSGPVDHGFRSTRSLKPGWTILGPIEDLDRVDAQWQ